MVEQAWSCNQSSILSLADALAAISRRRVTLTPGLALSPPCRPRRVLSHSALHPCAVSQTQCRKRNTQHNNSVAVSVAAFFLAVSPNSYNRRHIVGSRSHTISVFFIFLPGGRGRPSALLPLPPASTREKHRRGGRDVCATTATKQAREYVRCT